MRNDAYNAKNTIPHSAQSGWTLGYIGIPWPGPWPKLNGDFLPQIPRVGRLGLLGKAMGRRSYRLKGRAKDAGASFKFASRCL